MRFSNINLIAKYRNDFFRVNKLYLNMVKIDSNELDPNNNNYRVQMRLLSNILLNELLVFIKQYENEFCKPSKLNSLNLWNQLLRELKDESKREPLEIMHLSNEVFRCFKYRPYKLFFTEIEVSVALLVFMAIFLIVK